jgi:hypothetical protein
MGAYNPKAYHRNINAITGGIGKTIFQNRVNGIHLKW